MFVTLLMQNVMADVYYVSGFKTVKLSPESNWYHMHLKESKTLHALEIGEMCHVWICDLVVICIGEIWWMLFVGE